MIILAGMIGVGKTTYTSLLAQELGTTAFFEPVENNPILDKYYEDPEKYGFALQIYFLKKPTRLITMSWTARFMRMLYLPTSTPFKVVSATKNTIFI